MELNKTLAEALHLVDRAYGGAYEVNFDPTDDDLAAIEVVTSSRTITFDLEKDYVLIDAWNANSPVMVLLSRSAKRIVTISSYSADILGIQYVFRRPILGKKKSRR